MNDASPLRLLFVCPDNAVRSPLACAYAQAMAGAAVQVSCAGTEPAETVDPTVLEVLAEDGLSADEPTALTQEMIESADVVVSLGADESVSRGETHQEAWHIEIPEPLDADAVRTVRDKLKFRIAALLTDMHVTVRPVRKA